MQPLTASAIGFAVGLAALPLLRVVLHLIEDARGSYLNMGSRERQQMLLKGEQQ